MSAPPNVSATDVYTMSSIDLLIYRTLPPGMGQCLSLMSAGDLINTFIYPAISLSWIVPSSTPHGASVLVVECFSANNSFKPTDVGQVNGVDVVTTWRDSGYLLLTLGPADIAN